jgi:hypothetical protein
MNWGYEGGHPGPAAQRLGHRHPAADRLVAVEDDDDDLGGTAGDGQGEVVDELDGDGSDVGVEAGLGTVLLAEEVVVHVGLAVPAVLPGDGDRQLGRGPVQRVGGDDPAIGETLAGIGIRHGLDQGPLVAGERSPDPEAARPGQSGAVHPPGGDHHRHLQTRLAHRRLDPWMELLLEVEASPVEVEGDHLDALGENRLGERGRRGGTGHPCTSATSGLTQWTGRRPASTARALSAVSAAIAERVLTVALPRWGESTAVRHSARPGAIRGSSS